MYHQTGLRQQLLVRALKTRAHVYSHIGAYGPAIADLNRAYKCNTALLRHRTSIVNDREKTADQMEIMMLLSWIQKTTGRMTEASSISKKGLRIAAAFSKRLRLHLRQPARDNDPSRDTEKNSTTRINTATASGFYNLAAINVDKGHNIKGLRYLHKYYQVSRRTGNQSGMATAYSTIGWVYEMLGKHRRALKYLRKSLRVFEKIGDKGRFGMALNNLGFIYYSRCEYEQARIRYEKYLELSTTIGNRLGIALSLNNLGCLYFQKRHFDRAEEYLLKAEQLFRQMGDRYTLIETFLFLAELQLVKPSKMLNAAERLNRALVYHDLAWDLAGKLRSRYREANCLITLGRIHTYARRFKKACDSYRKAIHIYEKTGQKRDLVDAYFERGKLYAMMGQGSVGEKKYRRKAQWYTARARKLCKKMGLDRLLKMMST